MITDEEIERIAAEHGYDPARVRAAFTGIPQGLYDPANSFLTVQELLEEVKPQGPNRHERRRHDTLRRRQRRRKR